MFVKKHFDPKILNLNQILKTTEVVNNKHIKQIYKLTTNFMAFLKSKLFPNSR